MPRYQILIHYEPSFVFQREAKSAKRKAKSYKNDGLTTTKASIPHNIHTGLALSGIPAPAKVMKKVVKVVTVNKAAVKATGRTVIKTAIAKASKTTKKK